MIVLSIDPAGEFSKGKGVTGYCYFEVKGIKWKLLSKGIIKAADYSNVHEYWNAVVDLTYEKLSHVIVEEYRLYNHRNAKGENNYAYMQSMSLMETPRLIGVLCHSMYLRGVKFTMQMASVVGRKHKVEDMNKRGLFTYKDTNKLTYHKGFKLNDHERMAFRHFVYWVDKNHSIRR